MVGIIDYGVGNLFSLRSSFAAIGREAIVSADPELLRRADRLILPGVGAFEDAARKLRQSGLDRLVNEQVRQGKPLLGICLGMQMLFEESHEYGCHKGLGLLTGSVIAMEGVIPAELKIPHIGWNALRLRKPDCPLFADVREGDYVYFVHSFHAVGCEDSLAAVADYGAPITAAVARDNVYGCQFHPEKSGRVGLAILKAFCEV